MKLDHDCIRDIMLYMEENITAARESVGLNQLIENLPKYNEDVLIYHINQLVNADFIQKPLYGGGKPLLIPTFTWKGHEYLDNITNQTAWEKLKESGLSSMSMDVAKELIKEIVISLAKDKLKLK